MVSTRVNRITEPATLKMTELATSLQRKGEKVFNFGIGEPDFTTPLNIIDYALKSATEGKTHYTLSNGILELREAISSKLKSINNIDSDPSQILVTPTKFALNLALLTILEPGDNVIIIEPYFPSYPDIIKLADGVPTTVQTTENFDIDFDMIRKVVNPRTKAIMLCNPSNPTGKVYEEKTLREIANVVMENNLYLISDEIYEELIYDGRMFSPGSIPDMAERTITISGFSKSYAMTGWRIGYMTGPADIIKGANKVQQQTITCASSVSQYGALEALRDRTSITKMKEEYRKRRELVNKLLSSTDRVSFSKPNGAFYFFPSYKSSRKSHEFAMELLEKKHVAVTPGVAFGSQGEFHFRLSYATSADLLETGIERLNEYLMEVTSG